MGKKLISVQFFKYFFAASLGYAIDFGLLVFSKEVLHLHYLLASTIGFIAGLTVIYILSRKYVFGDSKVDSGIAEFGIFAAIGIVGLIFLNLIMWLLTDIGGINYLVSKIAATVVVYMWNFLARKSFYTN